MKGRTIFVPQQVWATDQAASWAKYAEPINMKIIKKYEKKWIIK